MSTIAPRRIKLLPILAWGYVAWSLVPVLIAVAYSFNDGRSRTMWQGFSFRWWYTLSLHDALPIDRKSVV